MVYVVPEFLSWVANRLDSLFLISSTAAVMLKSAGVDWRRKRQGTSKNVHRKGGKLYTEHGIKIEKV